MSNAVLGNRQKCYHYILRVTLVVTLFETILKTIAITAMTPERPLHVSLCEIRFARFAVGRISSSPPTPETLLNSRVSGVGGEEEIRTLEPLLTVTRFPVARPRPN